MVVVLASAVYFHRPHSAKIPIQQAAQSNLLENRYVDTSVCADCHTNPAETYRHTGMARSFSRPTISNTVGDQKNPVTFHHEVERIGDETIAHCENCGPCWKTVNTPFLQAVMLSIADQ